ncbi:hypothetical protein EI94DRAFT_567455 [Lactarius quietus]|nr:hypothetical protein EI94DRAFT_567455 [Lactarius quietus]
MAFPHPLAAVWPPLSPPSRTADLTSCKAWSFLPFPMHIRPRLRTGFIISLTLLPSVCPPVLPVPPSPSREARPLPQSPFSLPASTLLLVAISCHALRCPALPSPSSPRFVCSLTSTTILIQPVPLRPLITSTSDACILPPDRYTFATCPASTLSPPLASCHSSSNSSGEPILPSLRTYRAVSLYFAFPTTPSRVVLMQMCTWYSEEIVVVDPLSQRTNAAAPEYVDPANMS